MRAGMSFMTPSHERTVPLRPSTGCRRLRRSTSVLLELRLSRAVERVYRTYR